MQRKRQMTVEEVRYWFYWDEEINRLRWRNKPARRIMVGSVAGTVMHTPWGNRAVIKLFGTQYRHAYLVWLYHKGEQVPAELYVDHINGDTLDDYPDNLQLLPNADNSRRSRKSRGVTSKYRGVSWDKANKRWHAKVQVNKANLTVGRYDDELDAAAAAEFCAMVATAGRWTPSEHNLPPPPARLFKTKGWLRLVEIVSWP